MIQKTITGLILFTAISIQAEMYFDIRERKCFSYPARTEIDQNKYNEYVEDMYWDGLELSQIRKYNNTCIWRLMCVNAKKRAEEDNTATSRQFIADLERIPNIFAFEEIIGLSK